jgi:tetratricopeptide (TPR) repeat protein
MPRLSFYLFMLVSPLTLAQPAPVADSIHSKLINHKQRDTLRVLLLNQFAFSQYYADPVKSLNAAYEARQIADSLNFTRGQADAFRQVGLAFWAQADMPTAINYYLTGLHIARANKHKQVEADIIANIGTAYNGMGNPTEALTFLNQSIAMQQQLKNQWREAAILNNIGDAYGALGNVAQARLAYNKARDFARLNNYLLGVTTNTRNLGNLLEREQKYDSAIQHYQQSLQLSTEINDNRGIILSYKSMASVFLKTNQLKTAKEFAQLSLTAAKQVNLRAFVRDGYELLNKISENEGNKSQAYEYFKLYSTYKDSVQNLRTISDIASARLRFETDQKQTEIEFLKKDAEVKAAEIKLQKTQIWVYLIGLIVSIGCLLLALVYYKKMKAKNDELVLSKTEIETKNRLLREQTDELTTLNEELRSQQDQVIDQRDELIRKNQEIEKMNALINQSNQNLKDTVHQRTQALEDRNKRLDDYSNFNAHELRAPVASILGLINLIQYSQHEHERAELLKHLHETSIKLDTVVRSFNESLSADISKP